MSAPTEQWQGMQDRNTDKLELRVQSVTWEAPGIHSWDLRPASGGELPPFTAGAHIDIALPNGLSRSYSLVNPQSERHRYVIAAQKDPATRGGSKALHERVHTGDTVVITRPKNNFELDEAAAHTVLIAGGIGITPVLCMARRLTDLGRPWTLWYSARSRGQAAFVEVIETLASKAVNGRVHFHFDDQAGRFADVAAMVAAAPAGAHLYCCGPLPMLGAFEKAVEGHPAEQVHVEYFTAKEAPSIAGGFTVVLARAGREVFVPEGKTILQALLDEGLDPPYSCMEGVCGTCEIRVIEGTPEHKDYVLTASEQAAGKTMMICCSGSKSARLVLDL